MFELVAVNAEAWQTDHVRRADRATVTAISREYRLSVGRCRLMCRLMCRYECRTVVSPSPESVLTTGSDVHAVSASASSARMGSRQ